jgi:Methyltransferase domain
MVSKLTEKGNPRSFGSRLRARRWRKFLVPMIDAIYSQKKEVKIIDLGGERAYWLAFDKAYLDSRNVTITIVNLSANTVNLAMSSNETVNDPRFSMVIGDACNLSQFADASFDLVHSNSVIEHVGSWNNFEAFAAESRRLAPAYYLQTPYFWFPIEPHFIAPFIHWLPESLRLKIVFKLNVTGSYLPFRSMSDAMRLVRDAAMLDKTQIRYLFPDGAIRFEWFFLLPKSLIVTRSFYGQPA